jgi:hypothetical protein
VEIRLHREERLLYRIEETPVRFETTETVQTADLEVVLRALERTLPEISTDVIRDGHQITLRGLGPSPRARNPRDITVLQVSSDQAMTMIRADVSFQASALLGPASQDSVVRSKLDYVFNQVRTQISLEAEFGARREPVSPVAEVASPGVMPAAESHLRPPMDDVVGEAASAAQISLEPPVVPLPMESEVPSAPPVVEEVVAAVDRPVEEPVAAVVEEAAAAPATPLVAATSAAAAPSISAPAVEVEVAPVASEKASPEFKLTGSQPGQTTLVPALIAAIVALLLLFGLAVYYLLRPNPPDTIPASVPVARQPVSQSAALLISPYERRS